MYVDPGINTSASNLKWVLPYCKPDLPRVAGALLLFIANNTMALTIPILSGIIVDRVIVGGHTDELPRLCGLMILMTIIRVGARYGYQMWMERFGQNSVYRLVSDEYEKLHELDFTYFNHTRTGDIMSRLTSDTDAIRHCLSWVSYQIADCVVMFIGALCVMFAIDWRLALALACVTPFIFVLTRGLSTHAHPLFFAIRNSLASLNSMVEESIEGNRVVKAFVREPYETEKFDEHNDDYMQRNMALAYNSRKYMPWLDGLGFSLQLITLGLGGFLVIKGYMTLGNLVSFNSFLWMIDGPVRASGWLINDWQRFNASCIKIRKLLTEQPRIVEKPDAAEAVKQAVTIVEQVKRDDEGKPPQGAMMGVPVLPERPGLPEHPVPSSPPNASPARCASKATSALPTSVSPSRTIRKPRSSKTSTSPCLPAPNSASSARPVPASPRSSASSPASMTQPWAMCSSTASTHATGRWPPCARRCASWRRIPSCSPTPSAATSVLVPAVIATTDISRKWPRSPARTISSGRCRRVMTPSWANAAWACPAGRNSACRWPARSRMIRRS